MTIVKAILGALISAICIGALLFIFLCAFAADYLYNKTPEGYEDEEYEDEEETFSLTNNNNN